MPVGTVRVTAVSVAAVAVVNAQEYVTPVLPVCELLTVQLILVSVAADAGVAARPTIPERLSRVATMTAIRRRPDADLRMGTSEPPQGLSNKRFGCLSGALDVTPYGIPVRIY